MSLVSVCVSVCACNGSRHCGETRATPCRRPRAERAKRPSRLWRVPGSAGGSGHSGPAQGWRLGSSPPPAGVGGRARYRSRPPKEPAVRSWRVTGPSLSLSRLLGTEVTAERPPQGA